MTRHSSKPNKLRHINPVRGRTGNVTIQKWKIYYIKIKVIALIINFKWNKSVCTWKIGSGVTVYLAPLGSLAPGDEDTPGYLAPHPGYLHPGGQDTPARILPPIQNILSIKSFFLFPYAKTYYFYDIRIIIMMTTHVHSCKQITLNAWFLGMGVKIPWHGYLAPHPVLCLWALKIAN